MKLSIPGNTPSQKNRKIISRNARTGRPFLRSSPEVKLWQGIALIELRRQWRGYRTTNYPVAVVLVFYFDNGRRHDLDNACGTVMDALSASGVIEDDSCHYIDSITLQYGGIDKINPRCEIYLDD